MSRFPRELIYGPDDDVTTNEKQSQKGFPASPHSLGHHNRPPCLASILDFCQAIRLIVFVFFHATVAPGSTQHSSTNFCERKVRLLFLFLAFCACFFSLV